MESVIGRVEVKRKGDKGFLLEVIKTANGALVQVLKVAKTSTINGLGRYVGPPVWLSNNSIPDSWEKDGAVWEEIITNKELENGQEYKGYRYLVTPLNKGCGYLLLYVQEIFVGDNVNFVFLTQVLELPFTNK